MYNILVMNLKFVFKVLIQKKDIEAHPPDTIVLKTFQQSVHSILTPTLSAMTQPCLIWTNLQERLA